MLLQNAVCSVKNPAVWVVTPNTRLAAAATLWPTIPMRFPC
ncbi:Uncharacterised protein [Vibrio cholerae]|nr:Uncharacterised protein [Vibrio cholerae]